MRRRIMASAIVVLLLLGLPAIGGCSTSSLRDAAHAGVYDFISGTITDSLTALFPLAATLGGG